MSLSQPAIEEPHDDIVEDDFFFETDELELDEMDNQKKWIDAYATFGGSGFLIGFLLAITLIMSSVVPFAYSPRETILLFTILCTSFALATIKLIHYRILRRSARENTEETLEHITADNEVLTEDAEHAPATAEPIPLAARLSLLWNQTAEFSRDAWFKCIALCKHWLARINLSTRTQSFFDSVKDSFSPKQDDSLTVVNASAQTPANSSSNVSKLGIIKENLNGAIKLVSAALITCRQWFSNSVIKLGDKANISQVGNTFRHIVTQTKNTIARKAVVTELGDQSNSSSQPNKLVLLKQRLRVRFLAVSEKCKSLVQRAKILLSSAGRIVDFIKSANAKRVKQ